MIPQRTLHLVDIPNLVRGGRPSPEEVSFACGAYRVLAGHRPGDHAVVAAPTHPMLRLTAGLHWPEARLVASRAGAATALLEAVEPSWVADRFERVVIGSANKVFAPLAVALAGSGTIITVIGPFDSIPVNLIMPARDIAYLPPYPTSLAAVASTTAAA